MSVRPCSRCQGTMWCASHQEGGLSQPGNRHPPSRAARPMRCRAVNRRWSRPTLTTWPPESKWMGTVPSAQMRRSTEGIETGALCPSRCPAPRRRARSASVTSTRTAGVRAPRTVPSSAVVPRRISSTSASSAIWSVARGSRTSRSARSAAVRSEAVGPLAVGSVAEASAVERPERTERSERPECPAPPFRPARRPIEALSTKRGPPRRGDVAASTEATTIAADSGSSRPCTRVIPSGCGTSRR